MKKGKPAPKWYQQTRAIILLLVFFFPAGLYLMWKYANWDRVIKTTVSIILAIATVGVLASPSAWEEAQKNAEKPQTDNQPEQQEEANNSLAERVEQKFLENTGYESFSELRTDADWPADSKVRYITSFEDVSSGTVRMFVQDDITESEAKGVGRTVMGLVGRDLPELDWIVVRGTGGLDVNFSRNDIPTLR